jgi:hypothetical protein
MKNGYLVLTALAVLALAASPVLAQRGQGGRGGRGGMGVAQLISAKSVQEDAKISEEDAKKVTDELAKIDRQASAEERAEKTKKILADNLKPEQVKRLNQIRWQRAGVASALNDADVQAALKLDDKQKEKVKTIQDDTQKKLQDLLGQGGRGGRGRGGRGQGGGQANPQITELRKKANDDVTALLTDDQKKAWKELTGPEFKGEIPATGGRRGRGQDR